MKRPDDTVGHKLLLSDEQCALEPRRNIQLSGVLLRSVCFQAYPESVNRQCPRGLLYNMEGNLLCSQVSNSDSFFIFNEIEQILFL